MPNNTKGRMSVTARMAARVTHQGTCRMPHGETSLRYLEERDGHLKDVLTGLTWSPDGMECRGPEGGIYVGHQLIDVRPARVDAAAIKARMQSAGQQRGEYSDEA